MLSVTSARDDERPFWGSRHRMPQRAPMAWPNRRCAHCHLPPRALPDAQPQHHGAQCAEQHDKTTWRTTNISHHQAPVVRPARARSTHKCLTLRARFFPIANRPVPSHMLFLLLHLSLTSLCSLLHSILHATCTRALARPSEFRRRMESVAAALEPPLQVPCAAATCVPSASVNKAVANCIPS
jgi:hypothetical protein